MKNLDEIRDELAEKSALCWNKDEYNWLVYDSFKSGFDAAVNELEPTIKELVDALEQMVGHTVAHLQFPHKDTSSVTVAIITAKETLKKYKQKIGEK